MSHSPALFIQMQAFFTRHFLLLLLALPLAGCAALHHETRPMIVTAYCGCGECCEWRRGSPEWLHLDFWNRTISKGGQAGQPYTGETASGAYPRTYHPGLFSEDTLEHPWMFPVRLVWPWFWLERDGTVAADTRYYPFGTRMYIPEYGWGVVEDRGGAIKGPKRLDVFMTWHWQTERWGRKDLEVEIERAEK